MIIHLYETPLDISGKNVIDIVRPKNDTIPFNAKQILFDYFNIEFNHKEINADNRSIKKTQNTTTLTVPIRFYNIRNSNYCIIYDEISRDYYFYFITEIVSNNESVENPSSTLVLNWDVWNNNIDEISSRSANVTDNTILCKHYDRFSKNGNELMPLFYNKFQVNNVQGSHTTEVLGQRYIPMFLVLQFKSFPDYNTSTPTPSNEDPFATKLREDVWFYNTATETSMRKSVQIRDSVNGYYNRKLIYILAGLFDTLTEEYVEKFNIKSTKEFVLPAIEGTSNFTTEDIEDYYSTLNFNIDKVLLENITDMYFSFNSPFKFTSTRNSIEFEDVGAFRYNFVANLSNNNKSVCMLSSGIAYTSEQTIFTVLDSTPYYAKNDRFLDVDNSNKYGSMLTKSNFINKGVNILGNVNKIEPALHSYPFDYYSLHYNSNSYNILPIGIEEGIYSVCLSNRTIQPQFSITRGFFRLDPSTNIFISMPPTLSYSLDAETSYMLRNGEQVETSRRLNDISFAVNSGMNIGGIVASAYAKNVGGVISGVKGLVNSTMNWYSAKETLDVRLRDVKNTPDQWIPSMGECDIKYQDRLRLIRHFMFTDTPTYINYSKYFYKYGYEIQSIGNVFDNVRTDFDFCITKDCNLSNLIINSNDRIELENIFNRGVFKWHIIINENGERIHSPSNFDINENENANIEHKFITDPVYQNWVNS